MRSLAQDLRHGLRLLAKSPGFAIAAVVVLALGIGANTAIFSVVDTVLLEPLPFPDPNRIVRVWHVPPASAFPGLPTFPVSPANYLDWEKQNDVFEKMALVGFASLNLTGSGEPEAVPAARVSRDFFAVLGAHPALGRTFTPEEEAAGAARVVVLSHAFWQSRFGGDRGIVGREIRFDEQVYRVIGVMGPDAFVPRFARVWVPYGWTPAERAVRDNHNRSVVARLKPGVDLKRAQAEMNVISNRLARQYPEDDAGWGALVVPLQADMVGDVRSLLLVLLAAVAFVLLIACANVANLMLARTLARRKEIAIRSALGAGRARLLRQLIAESLLLALIGGALGLFFATFGIDGIVALIGRELPRPMEVGLNVSVLGFTLAVSIATGVLAGLVPAWRGTRTNLADSLKQGLGRTDSDSGGSRARGVLVVSEVALSLVLLMGAGLLIRTLWLLRRVDPGFDPRHVTTMSVVLPRAKTTDPVRATAFFQSLVERVRALPGVESAGAVSVLPFRAYANNWPVAVEGRPVPPVSQQPNVAASIVAGDYFRAMRIPILRGRGFTSADNAEAPGVVLISESMARRFWPNEDPIGKRLTTATYPEKTREVVGIVGDVKYEGLDHREPVPAMYVPLAQISSPAMDFAIRAEAPGIAKAAVAAVHALDPAQPAQDVGSMEQLLSSSLSHQRFGMLLLGTFAALALVLAAVGIYSVLAYAVRNRGREIGIRIALGAETSDVLRLVVIEGMRPTFLGMGIGIAAALALGRTISSLIYGITPADPLTLAAVAILLGLVAFMASLLPALRATRVDPIRVLREE